MKIQEATLIIASSEEDSNLYYVTRFLAPDPFIFFQIGQERIIIISDLEIDRAKAEARVDSVLSYSFYEERAKNKGLKEPDTTDILHEFLMEREITTLVVPAYFGVRHALLLQDKGYDIEVREDPFYSRRLIKDDREIGYIASALEKAEKAMDIAIDRIRNSVIRDGHLYYDNEQLTSEKIKRLISIYLLEQGFSAQHTIVSCGEDTSYPHKEGTGPLKANEPIIIDIFPRSMINRYYADITRTVVKGRATDQVKKMYESVLKAQYIAMSMIEDGISGRKVHEALLEHFRLSGFESGNINGRMQGFIHGTGHGVGLDVHEPPRINKRADILREGNVVTIEPGLYYEGIGGVRLEDMVVVKGKGVLNLTKYPKLLEI